MKRTCHRRLLLRRLFTNVVECHDQSRSSSTLTTTCSVSLPLVHELLPVPEVMTAARALANWPNLLLLDSALLRDGVGRYSFLMADPWRFDELQRATNGTDPFAVLRGSLTEVDSVPGLPPFQGGAAGLLGFGLGHAWERIPEPRCDEFRLPDLAVGLYDWVIAWDHVQQRAWIISQGFPETTSPARDERARQRIDSVIQMLQSGPASTTRNIGTGPSTLAFAPQSPLVGHPDVTSNFSRAEYLAAVARAIEYIYAGDVFQVNLSQRLLCPLRDAPLDLYARLRERNAAPFAGYFAHADWVIASASPERFVSVSADASSESPQSPEKDCIVETRPIKGTRRRPASPEADLFMRDELRESDKDQAENVMIVDLLRNDLSRVCRPGSIRVPRLCAVETYATVQHLVSVIQGKLAAEKTLWDLLAAAFPGGSVTGAPKVRALEIIAELEPTARGPYCGSLFYAGHSGNLDSSILIRTFTIRHGWIQCPVGGGIIARSTPEDEYAETLHKAEGMLRAL